MEFSKEENLNNRQLCQSSTRSHFFDGIATLYTSAQIVISTNQASHLIEIKHTVEVECAQSAGITN
jgi:hypothetical protein